LSTDIWNTWNDKDGPKYPHEKVIQFCFRNYRPAERKNVHALDIGCGSGVHCEFLSSEGFQVTGIDISEVGIANTKNRLNAKKLDAKLRVEGADVLDFSPNSFDLVICVGVYDSAGFKVAQASVKKLPNIMKSGGRGLFIFASARDFRLSGENPLGLTGYTQSEVAEIFAHSFSNVWIDHYITTYQGGKMEQNDWLITVEK
jgi:cyclopropane fatty-acyl-phospholipid synthase-like methyltransferase